MKNTDLIILDFKVVLPQWWTHKFLKNLQIKPAQQVANFACEKYAECLNNTVNLFCFGFFSPNPPPTLTHAHTNTQAKNNCVIQLVNIPRTCVLSKID